MIGTQISNIIVVMCSPLVGYRIKKTIVKRDDKNIFLPKILISTGRPLCNMNSTDYNKCTSSLPVQIIVRVTVTFEFTNKRARYNIYTIIYILYRVYVYTTHGYRQQSRRYTTFAYLYTSKNTDFE